MSSDVWRLHRAKFHRAQVDPDRLKVPIRHREEFVVAGYLPNPREFSMLILGRFNREGNFAYAGFCGTGLSETTRAVLLEELHTTRRKTCPFRTMPLLRDDFRELPDTPPQWVRPTVVVQVEYRKRLKSGLRHAALKGIRPDKKPRPLLWEGSQAKDRLAPPKGPAFPGSDGSKGKGHPTLLRMPPNSRRSRRDC